MIQSNHLVAYDKDGIGVVRAPRSTDAIGIVLRDAFAGRTSLPADRRASGSDGVPETWVRLLRDLDRSTPRPH